MKSPSDGERPGLDRRGWKGVEKMRSTSPPCGEGEPSFRWEHKVYGKGQASEEEPAPLGHRKVEAPVRNQARGRKGRRWSKKFSPYRPSIAQAVQGRGYSLSH